MVQKEAVPTVSLADLDVASIDQRAILVYCHLGKPGTVKENVEETAKLNAAHGVAKGIAKVKQETFPGAVELDEVVECQREFRKFHYGMVTRYGQDGWGLMASRNLDEYKKTATESERKFKILLDTFMVKYPELIEDAKTRLKSLWRERDYPHPIKMRSKFAFEVGFKRIAESNSGLIGVSDDLRREIAAAADARVRAGVQQSMEDVVERITKVIGNVNKVLADRGEGKIGRVHETLLGNIVALADEIPKLNVLDNPRLNEIAARMKAEFAGIEPDDLKESEDVRKAVVATAESIAADLAGIF